MDQLTIYIENKPGSLYKILNILSENSINVRSVSTERANFSQIRLIVDDVEGATATLEAMGVTVHVIDIVVVELGDKPGQLATIASLCDKRGLNIDYMYAIDNDESDKGLFAIKTDGDSNDLRELLVGYTLY
ncbi:MAG: ACT domain-containing protein [Candidatus Kariarchaeaceae archaeon]|jgi:hypothetical protein